MTFLVEWLWQGLLIAVVTTAIVRVVPAGSASKRHAIWWLALVLTMALPWVPAAWFGGASTASLSTIDAQVPLAAVTLPPPPHWLPVSFAAAWLLMASIGVTRLLTNLVALRSLLRDSSPLTPDREARLSLWMAARSSSRPARLRLSPQIRGACAIGFRHPRILVSAELAEALSDEALEAVVLHEHAHLQRYDDWTRLVQRVALTVAGVHPAVRWISRQIDFEREVACDQRVVDRTGAPVVYARSLAMAAAVLTDRPGAIPDLAPAMSMKKGMLHARVRRLIATGPASARSAWATSTACAVAMLTLTIAIAGVPTMVGFASLAQPLHAFEQPFQSLTLSQGIPSMGPRDNEQAPTTTVDLQEETAAAVESPAVEPVAEQTAATVTVQSAPLEEPLAPLASTQMTGGTAMLVPSAQPLARVSANLMAQPFIDLGDAAARMGVATGVASSRAGTSIGRFFASGARSVARPF